MKTLAVRRNLDRCFLGFRVLIQGLGFYIGFQGFRVFVFSGFWVLGFVKEEKNANTTHGFEHVKGYAGSNVGKRGVCGEYVLSRNAIKRDVCMITRDYSTYIAYFA